MVSSYHHRNVTGLVGWSVESMKKFISEKNYISAHKTPVETICLSHRR